MYYRDLSYYRDGGDYGKIHVYPLVKNVGWLGKKLGYEKGDISSKQVQKLKEIIFLDLKNQENKRNRTYESNKAINIHCMHIKDSAFKCNLCIEEKEVEYEPLNLKYYTGTSYMKAGLNEVCIPSIRTGEFYSFPTMLLHYITEHSYLPPKEFLNALDAFNLNVSFDIDKAQEELDILQVTRIGLENYN